MLAPIELSRISRRHFLYSSLLAVPLLSGTLARAQDARSLFTLAQLQHGDNWNPYPTALRRLLWELAKRTSVEVESDAVSLNPCTQKLPYLPLAYLAVEGPLQPFSNCAQRALRSYIHLGGTLIIDAVHGGPGSAFARSLAPALKPLSDQKLRPVSRKHVLFQSFYLLNSVDGRTQAAADLEALTVDGRLAVIVSHNDLGGAWARSNLGVWENEVIPGGSAQRERAFRLGINIVMYALCLDYKADQVHIPFILKKRRHL